MSLRRDLSGFHRLHDARTTLKPVPTSPGTTRREIKTSGGVSIISVIHLLSP